MTDHHTMRASMMSRVITTARKMGCELAPIEVVDGRVSLTRFYDALEKADGSCGPLFSIEVAKNIEVADFDASGFLMMTSASLGDAIRRALRFQTLWSDGERYAISEDAREVRITMSLAGPPRRAHEMMTEMAFYDLAVNSRPLVGRPLPALALAFAQPRSAEVPYEDLFGCALSFNTPTSTVSFSAEAMSWPMAMQNEALEAYFLGKATEELAQRVPKSTLSGRVLAFLSGRLESPPTTSDVAAHFKMSERTLQRQLRQEGASFHQLLVDLRKRRARELLSTSMSISEIAYLLGYSEPSAFHRAFKRWFGCAPSEHRARG